MLTLVEQDNLRIVSLLYDAFGAGDLETVKSYLDLGVELHEAASLPFGGSYIGYDQVLVGVGNVLGTWESAESSLQFLTVGGDWVVAYVEMDVTTKKNRKRLRFQISEMWRLRNGKVVEIRPLYSDTHLIRSAVD
jgi:ketosteroid isomerase-like protein